METMLKVVEDVIAHADHQQQQGHTCITLHFDGTYMKRLREAAEKYKAHLKGKG